MHMSNIRQLYKILYRQNKINMHKNTTKYNLLSDTIIFISPINQQQQYTVTFLITYFESDKASFEQILREWQHC